MPKSKRGKHLSRSQRKGKKVFSAPAASNPAAAQVSEPASRAGESPPPTSAPKPKAPVAVARVSNITAELRRIGILAGIIIVILVILALIFA